ncbi:glycoside hydrolase [Punctularia strigosozonata HHB-11173 SS5]|uniref:glycoside hydrolase n=1 Tax=Punctularia strigosozonata (strain HHB-11173) TaxID=741275 RepID=UPI000441867C|nr:glycoside hydrolase [Punctularia strigosozonata HHB-11173 SS5]EIN14712.1 glycoside hydrolase [Punctularia strigosozonata HHB-11173 SS5]
MSESSPLDASFVVVDRDASATGAAPRLNPTNAPASSKSGPIPPKTAHVPYAHDWSKEGTNGGISVQGRHFVDGLGRICSLRGVNLSGSSKTPVNHDHERFPADHEGVTFVGRPFTLEEAPQHFARLRRWGLTFVRFLVTWEAVEHAGPGQYDHEYLTYIRSLLSLLPQYGLVAFVSLHQDVWSRYSGGSGAPAWTLEQVGFDLHALEDTGAAWLVGVKGGGHVEAERGIWPCGYQKLAAATLNTCFWAGDTFTPKLKVKAKDGTETSVQQFLQNAFLNMWDQVVKAVGDLPAVLGFEIMNEPHRGYVELKSLHEFVYETDLHLSHVPSAMQSFLLGSGHPTRVGHWTRSFPMPTRLTGSEVLNPHGKTCWRADGPTSGQCIWEMHGVWGWDKRKDEGVVLRESYFVKHPMTGKKVEWYEDYYYPFVKKWAERVRGVAGADKIVFVEPIPNEFCPESWTPERRPANLVYAPHWYDLNALFAKAFGDFTVNVQALSRGAFPLNTFYWGQRGARDNYALQMKNIVEAGYRALGETPVIIGECGIPMDMNKGEAFKSDNWEWQGRMMDAMMTALERALIGFTLWNYNPDNADHIGDDWNGENFSWFSRTRALPKEFLLEDQTSASLDQGGRILQSVIRPYPAKIAGIPLKFDYEATTGKFAFEWATPDPSQTSVAAAASVSSPPLNLATPSTAETQIYVPSMVIHGRKLVVKGLRDGDTHRYVEELQTLFVTTEDTTPGSVHKLVVELDPPLKAPWIVNDFWTDFGVWVWTVLAAIISFIVFRAIG